MKQTLPHLIKTRRFTIPNELIPRLRELQEESKQHLVDKIAESEDAVIMSLGMGAAMYLTLDGRVIIDEDDNFLEAPMQPYEARNEKEIFTAVIIGAKTRKAPELLSLLPERPTETSDCAECKSRGWKQFGEAVEIICIKCGGIGWVTNN
jgi:hypothetical protein